MSNGETTYQEWRKKRSYEALGTYHHTEKINRLIGRMENLGHVQRFGMMQKRL